MKRYLTIINIILITAIVYFSVKAFYKIAIANLDLIDLHKTTDLKPATSINKSTPALSHYTTIIERNLFNTKTKAGNKIKQVNIETLAQTDLKLKLWGTVLNEGGKAYAVIEEKKSRIQNLFRIGDTIQTATVKMILKEKVILSVNGKDEILIMEEARSSQKKISEPERRKKSLSKKIRLKRSLVDGAVKNINDLMKKVRILPHPDGINLTSIKPGSIFRKMGLRSGDIITGVNGQDIESVDDVLGFYESLKSSSDVRLQIKRKGRMETIEYNIK